MMHRIDGRWRVVAALSITLMLTGCSGRQGGEPRSAADPDEGAGPAAATSEGEVGTASVAEDQHPACVGYVDTEVDPLQRWIRAYPIENGGAVMVFMGPSAEQMEVEAALEMAAIEGYEDQSCGSAVIVWVPGMECQGDETTLAQRIEAGTSMIHSETTCFRIDEVRPRLREECDRGTIPAERCSQ